MMLGDCFDLGACLTAFHEAIFPLRHIVRGKLGTAREVFVDLISTTIGRRGAVPAPVTPILPAVDLTEEIEKFIETDNVYAEGQTFIIEYVDAKQQESRRRITVWKVVAGAGGVPILRARCHERNANRDFRVDRIQSIVDLNGEIFEDVPAYLEETLGISRGLASSVAEDDRESTRNWRRMLEAARPYAVLLAAISLADGAKLVPEIAVAADYCTDHCERQGFEVDFTTTQAFSRYLTGLRPSFDRCLKCIDEILGSSPDDIIRFMKACVCVVEADGLIHKSEAEMLDEICRDLTGLSLGA